VVFWLYRLAVGRAADISTSLKPSYLETRHWVGHGPKNHGGEEEDQIKRMLAAIRAEVFLLPPICLAINKDLNLQNHIFSVTLYGCVT